MPIVPNQSTSSWGNPSIWAGRKAQWRGLAWGVEGWLGDVLDQSHIIHSLLDLSKETQPAPQTPPTALPFLFVFIFISLPLLLSIILSLLSASLQPPAPPTLTSSVLACRLGSAWQPLWTPPVYPQQDEDDWQVVAESRLLLLLLLPPLTGAQTQMLLSASAHNGSVASHPGGGDLKTMATGWRFDDRMGGDLSLSAGLFVARDCVVDDGSSDFPPMFAPLGDGFRQMWAEILQLMRLFTVGDHSGGEKTGTRVEDFHPTGCVSQDGCGCMNVWKAAEDHLPDCVKGWKRSFKQCGPFLNICLFVVVGFLDF